MSVINILMQLRKVCNHPDLFDPRPIVSSFAFETIDYHVPSLVFNINEEINAERLEFLFFFQPAYPVMELLYSAFNSHRAKHLQTPRKLIEDVMSTVPSFPLVQTTHLASDSAAESSSQGSNKDSDVNKYDLSKCFYDSKFSGLSLVDNVALQNRLRNEVLNKQLPFLNSALSQRLKNKIHYLIRTNKQRCNFFKPMYGTDLQGCIGREAVMLSPIKVRAFFLLCIKRKKLRKRQIRQNMNEKSSLLWLAMN